MPFGLQILHRLEVTSYKLQVTSYKLQVTTVCAAVFSTQCGLICDIVYFVCGVRVECTNVQ